jgi:putative toxin-antitoxin system antitoxin component (TIGR02293 family)
MLPGDMDGTMLRTFVPPSTQPPRPGRSIGVHGSGPDDVIAELKRGLPAGAFERLRRALGLERGADLAAVVGISERTLARRQRAGRFTAEESERLFRIARLLDVASDVLGGPDAARRWLRSPRPYLGGRTPLAYADTEIGAQVVERLLGRIEHGVVS